MTDMTPSRLEWAKFIVGALFFGVMLVLHVFVKELPLVLLAVPGLLMGLDPVKLFQVGRK